jgi:hypothetical protein
VIDHHLADEVEKPKPVEGHAEIWSIQPEGAVVETVAVPMTFRQRQNELK